MWETRRSPSPVPGAQGATRRSGAHRLGRRPPALPGEPGKRVHTGGRGCQQMAQTTGLETAEIYPLPVQEAGRLTLRCLKASEVGVLREGLPCCRSSGSRAPHSRSRLCLCSECLCVFSDKNTSHGIWPPPDLSHICRDPTAR